MARFNVNDIVVHPNIGRRAVVRALLEDGVRIEWEVSAGQGDFRSGQHAVYNEEALSYCGIAKEDDRVRPS
jgi:hypothetical protein